MNSKQLAESKMTYRHNAWRGTVLYLLIKKVKYLLRNLTFWLFHKTIFNSFDFYITKDPKEIDDVYRIRYDVYCEEYGYIDKSKFPDKKETDEYDKYSDYLIIRDKQKEIAATVRVINDSPLGLPIEKHFKLNMDLRSLDERKTAEISRLIVAKKYRKKHLLIFILKGLSVYAINRNYTNAFCIIDERLYPLLKKLHVPLRIIGDKQLYQGVTFPCLIVISEWIEEVRKNKVMNSFFTYKGLEFNNGKYVIH